mmetsp:Transcript_10494/g.30249  ORF Transcript_10494/g.30249 Transcript_10494/m.30249 type:complete len:287 (-) Transcript_10494:467-1327(-)
MLLLLVLLGEWATAVVAFVPPLGHAVRHLRHVGAHSGGQQQQLDVRRAEPTEWMAALPLPTVVVQSSSSTPHRRRRLRGSTALMVTNDADTAPPAKLDSLIRELREEKAALDQEKAELSQQFDLALKQPEDKETVINSLQQLIVSTDQRIVSIDNRLNTLYQALFSTQRPEGVTKEDLKAFQESNKAFLEDNKAFQEKLFDFITTQNGIREIREQQRSDSHPCEAGPTHLGASIRAGWAAAGKGRSRGRARAGEGSRHSQAPHAAHSVHQSATQYAVPSTLLRTAP